MSDLLAYKRAVPAWLIAGLYFCVAAVPPTLLAVVSAPGWLLHEIGPFWLNNQNYRLLIFVLMGLSSAFIAGSLAGKVISKSPETAFQGKTLLLGFSAVVIAFAIFIFENSIVTGLWTRADIPWAQKFEILIQSIFFDFMISCWLTVPFGILAASKFLKRCKPT